MKIDAGYHFGRWLLLGLVVALPAGAAQAIEIDRGVAAKVEMIVPIHDLKGEAAKVRFRLSIRNNYPLTNKAPWEERDSHGGAIDLNSLTAEALGILGFGLVNDAARAAAERLADPGLSD